MPYVKVKGEDVYYLDFNPGAPETIVMAHGLFTSMAVFLFCGASALCARFRVLLYDLRSHGMSAVRDDGYTLDTLADDMLELMDALGVQTAHAAGYSYGGAVALNAALLAPGRFRKVALIDSPGLLPAEVDKMLVDMRESNVERELRAYERSIHFAIPERRRVKAVEIHRRLCAKGVLQRSVEHDRGFVSRAPLEQFTKPLLLLYAKKSPYIRTAHEIASRAPAALLRTTWGDHNLPVKRTRWVQNHLVRFFS